ncbi:MAG: UDP-N-acetylmuramate dehydrogenase [Chlorobi bacterium]|nr:UDP-N-acetylmuramate dehydrogenase [Chlorobiota bacterium]
MKIIKNKSLKEFNSFAVEAKAKLFAEINSIEDLFEAAKIIESENYKFKVIGEGSNVLFTKDFDGLILCNKIKGVKVVAEDDDFVFVEVASGEIWDEFVARSVENNWSGIENLSGIPGTAGAAPIQNIGAYGVELKDVLISVGGLDVKKREVIKLTKDDCEFGYRTSVFKNALSSFVITGIVLRLKKKFKPKLSYKDLTDEFKNISKDKITLQAVRNAVLKIREKKLPDPKKIPNGGSFFKNPVISKEEFKILKKRIPEAKAFQETENSVKISAALLIDKAGLKGFRSGDAGVYENHALILVNYGNASGKEILSLAENICDTVFKKFNISLRFEVNIL